MNKTVPLLWKPDWAVARQALTAWWEHRGLALQVRAPKDVPWETIAAPSPLRDVEQQWTDVEHWVARHEAGMARTFFGGVAFPALWTLIGGPGSLGLLEKVAAQIGLINRAVAAGTERSEAIALAELVASKSSYVLKIGKQAFYRQAEMTLAAAYDYASEVMTENMMARDANEGICAFIEKRDPTWEDR